MWKLLLIIPWIGAGALAWWYTETNGSRIKKQDAALYEKINNDKDGKEKTKLKTALPTLKTEQETDKTKLETLKKKTDATDDEKTEITTLEETIAKRETEIQITESIDGKMWMPVFSISNIAWMLGIFFGVGIIGHFIFKQIIKLFAGEKSE